MQEQGGHAIQEGCEPLGAGQIASDDLDPGGQVGGLRVADDRADLDALGDQDVDEGPSDGA
jgi:hypothetical protein